MKNINTEAQHASYLPRALRGPKPQRIYLLGVGSIGKFIAHSLRSLPEPPPVTLLLHNLHTIKDWKKSPREIRLVSGEVTDLQTGYDWEPAIPLRRRYGVEVDHDADYKRSVLWQGQKESNDVPLDEEVSAVEQQQAEQSDVIDHLIVSVKATSTISALSTVRHRLKPSSTVLFMQNGMGIVDEVNKVIFPDSEERPNYLQGIISHGVRSSANNMWEAVHTGFGTVQLGLLPGTYRDSSVVQNLPDTAKYLLRTLTSIPALVAVSLAPTELLQAQLEKLAINAVINPLTALLDARNGSILYNFFLTRAQRLLIAEISLVLRSLPELKGVLNVENRFSPDRLETLVVGVAAKTAKNVSSMLADVRRGRETEIEYINGYIVKRGEEIGIKCLMNYLVMQLVAGKTTVIDQEMRGYVPLILKEMEANSKL